MKKRGQPGCSPSGVPGRRSVGEPGDAFCLQSQARGETFREGALGAGDQGSKAKAADEFLAA